MENRTRRATKNLKTTKSCTAKACAGSVPGARRDARRSQDSERDARRTRCDSEADTTNLESRATRDARRDVSDLTLARRATATRYEPPDDLKKYLEVAPR